MKTKYSDLKVNFGVTVLDGIEYQTGTVVVNVLFRAPKIMDIFRKAPTKLTQDFTISFNWYFRDSGEMVRPLDINHLEKKQIGEKLYGCLSEKS